MDHLTVYRLKRTSFSVSNLTYVADTISDERLRETRTSLIIHEHETIYRLRSP